MILKFIFYLARILDYILDNRLMWFFVPLWLALLSIPASLFAWRKGWQKQLTIILLALMIFAVGFIAVHEVANWYVMPLDPPLQLTPRPCAPYPSCLEPGL